MNNMNKTSTEVSPLLLRAEEVSALFSISRATFYRRRLDRQIPCVVVGGTRLWHRRDVEEWAERQRHTGGSHQEAS